MRFLLASAALATAGVIAGIAAGEKQPQEQKGATESAMPVAEKKVSAPATEVNIATAGTREKSARLTGQMPIASAEISMGPKASAVTALRQGMDAGDPRTPPLATHTGARRPPTAEELADPDLYRAYEARQKSQVYASFAEAATEKISSLEEMITRADRGGITAAQLEEAKEKVTRLREQRALLLQQHPELETQKSENQ